MLSLVLLSILCNIWQINGQMVTDRRFIQEPTGPSSVCVGSSVIFNCTVEIVVAETNVLVDAQWRRDGVVITNGSTPRHTLIQTQPRGTPIVTGVMVDNTTLNDNGIVYTCTAVGAPDNFTSDVTLNVTGGPPSPITSIAASDTSCLETDAIVSWDPSTSDPVCGNLAYNVTISPSDGVVVMIINDTSYNFTALTPGTDYTVTVAGNNMAGVGESNMTMFNILTMNEVPPSNIPSPVGLRNVSRICVTFFNISWNASNRIKCGDVSYNVLVFQSSIGQRMKQIPADNDTFYFSVTGLNNSDPNVTITVIASNRAGQGNMSIPVRLPESLGPPQVERVTFSASIAPLDLNGFDIMISWDQPPIDRCTTLPIAGYIIEATVVFVNGNNSTYASRFIRANDSISRISVSYNSSFPNVRLEPGAHYNFDVNSTHAVSEESDDPTDSGGGIFPGVSTELSVIIIIIIIVVCIIIIIIIIGVAYVCYKKKKKDKDEPHSTTVTVLLISSCGVGYLFWTIYRWWSQKDSDVQPDKLEMTGVKSSDLYASPHKKQEDTDGNKTAQDHTDGNKTAQDHTDGNKTAQDQALYSYARTGPINVVVPGGRP